MFGSFGQYCSNFSSIGRSNIEGIVMMLIGLVLVIVVVYLVVKKGTFSNTEDSESPLVLLQKRYVNGEINEEEYLSKKEILKGSK